MKNIITNTSKLAYKGMVFGLFSGLTVFGVAYAASITSTTDTVNSGDSITANWYQDVNNKLGGISVSGGNVGIGTSSPTEDLTISGTKSGNSVTDAILDFGILNSNGDSKKSQIKAIGVADISSELIFSTTKSHSFAERMRINLSGNVGIGTATPSAKLDVDSGTDLRIGTFTNTPTTVKRGGGFYGDDVDGGRSIMWLDSNDGNFSGGDYFYISHNSGNTGTSLSIQNTAPMSFATSGAERMRIDGYGNVGIGTTTPKAKLDVQSSMTKITEGTYILYLHPPSGTTTSIAEIIGYDRHTMAVAKAKYVQIYAWAGSGIGTGEILASTRRANDGTAWVDIDNKHIISDQTQTTNPNLFWENGVLKISTGGSNAGVYTIEITINSGDIKEL